MAQLSGSVVTMPKLKVFKEETDKAYVAQVEGKTLTSNDYDNDSKAKLDGLENIKEVQVNGQKLTVGEDGIVNIDVEGVITGDNLVSDDELSSELQKYTETSKLAEDPGLVGKFLDQTTAGQTYATKEEMGNLGTIIGECSSEELESKKEETGKGDCWVTTDNNHINYYNGESFIDLGGDIDLAPYLKSADATNQFVAKDGDKVLVSPTDVTQITTNKTDIASLKTDKADASALENYVLSESITEPTDEEIRQLFSQD